MSANRSPIRYGGTSIAERPRRHAYPWRVSECASIVVTASGYIQVHRLAAAEDHAVTAAGCMADAITVNGRQQPSLWDTAGGLDSMARKLLGLS